MRNQASCDSTFSTTHRWFWNIKSLSELSNSDVTISSNYSCNCIRHLLRANAQQSSNMGKQCSGLSFFEEGLKPGLHLNVNADERRGRMYGTFVHCLAFAEAANWPYINVLYANSLWSTDSQWIVFGCLPNVRCTAEYCLPHLGNTFTLHFCMLRSCSICVQVETQLYAKEKLLNLLAVSRSSSVYASCINFTVSTEFYRISLFIFHIHFWKFEFVRRNKNNLYKNRGNSAMKSDNDWKLWSPVQNRS